MLVQALAGYADVYLQEQLGDRAFEEKPVPFAVEIDDEGRFLTIRERMTERTRGEGKKRKTVRVAETLLVPKSPVNRNTGVHPLLVCDAVQYVVGPALSGWTGGDEESKHAAHHAGFVQLIKHAAGETSDPGLEACAAFYGDDSQVAAARDALVERKPVGGALVALVVRPRDPRAEDPGGPVSDRVAVRAFWRDHFSEKFAERHAKGGEATCLISGKFGRVAVTHEKIKGVSSLGGQAAGVSLMSFDKEAFRSYGWDRNANSPVSPERAAAYVLGLNDLLRPGEHRRGLSRDTLLRTRSDYGGIGFLYWTREPSDDDLFGLAESPDADKIAELLRVPYSGDSSATEGLDPNDYYLLAVSGNGGRLVIRDWFCESLDKMRGNVAAWIEGLRIADVFKHGEPSAPPRLWELLMAVSPPRVKASDKVNAERAIRMVRRALYGQPLGPSVLAAALGRLRVESGTNRLAPVRVGLVRLCVNDIVTREGQGERLMSESLDPHQDHPAYICGSLLAVYDGLQYQAHRDPDSPGQQVGASVVDRYYALASTYPQLAFPKLEALSRAHLRKLRRDRRAAEVAISRRIDGLIDRLSAQGAKFPAQLSLEDQGRFVIGFHHQKADDQRRIAQRAHGPEEPETDE